MKFYKLYAPCGPREKNISSGCSTLVVCTFSVYDAVTTPDLFFYRCVLGNSPSLKPLLGNLTMLGNLLDIGNSMRVFRGP